MINFGLSEKHTKICAIFLMLCIPIYFVKNSFRLSWCIKDLRGTKFMYYYVLKWPVFRLQRGSAKSHLAPSDFSSLCQRRGSIQCVPIWTFLGFLQPSKGKNLLFCYIKWHFLGYPLFDSFWAIKKLSTYEIVLNQSHDCQRGGCIQRVPIWTFLGFLQPSKNKNLLFLKLKEELSYLKKMEKLLNYMSCIRYICLFGP